MPIRVDPNKCNGCGICVEMCLGDVLRMDENTKLPFTKYPDDCWYCGACEADCPEGALELILPYLVI